MILLSAHSIGKTYGARPLMKDLSFVVESGERIALIGPNGVGKSTLLRILAGRISPDEGDISQSRGLRVGYLEQEPELVLASTVEQIVSEGTDHAPDSVSTVHELLARFELDGEQKVGELSGGWRKRVALARELAREPDLLLLDEPTNHLDVESILWLEGFMARADFASVTVTHDRLFLQRTANRILELDPRNPGGILSVKGDYANYVERKSDVLSAQEKLQDRLSNRLRRETEWLRRGAKARTTKQQARINRAGDLKDEVEDINFRTRDKVMGLEFSSAGRSPHRLIEAKKISKSLGGKTLFKNVDMLITPESRIGLLGRNGSGKSTFIRCLLGELPVDHGEVFRSEKLKPAYFEQNRESLDPDQTLVRALIPGGDSVIYRGRPVHVKSYLDRFLFRSEQLEMKVGRLSGGERSRLLIARLMLKEANLLILDEPTNDLDSATLDVLEDVLKEFEGAVLLVTHDRYFLDQVAGEIFTFDHRDDHVGETVTFAGLSQWETWRSGLSAAQKAAPVRNAEGKKVKKLSYKEQREWDTMEENIGKAEARLTNAQEALNDPNNASNASKLSELSTELDGAQDALDKLFERWAELEKLKTE